MAYAPEIARHLRGRVWPLPVAVLLGGLLLTLLAALQLNGIADRRDRERFEDATRDAQAAIESRLQAYVTVLRGADGLFAAKGEVVTRTQFRAFAVELELGRYFPGIQGVGYSARLPAVEGPATRAILAELGVPDLKVRPAHPRAEAHAIVHLEPLDRRNQAAIGYDMFSEPVRREAMERARDTGHSAMSGKVELVQEIDRTKQAGFLIYHPVYRGLATPQTVEARRAALAGFVYAPFRADDLLQGIFGGEPRVDFAIYDASPQPANLLHKTFPGAPEARAAAARLTLTRPLVASGRRWVVVYHSTPLFEAQSSRWFLVAFAIGGLVASGLVSAAVWRQVRARLAAEAEIAARRATEQQRRLLMDELNHRVKNTLATVQSIAAQALREGRSVSEARDTFESRLLALSQTHNLLTRDSWRGAQLQELVEVELAPYRGPDPNRVLARGPAVYLMPETALAIGMTLHELATNAAKYGALSAPEGRVRLSWDVQDDAGGRRLRLLWREEGGPPVTPPTARGFGTRLIATGLRRQLGGEVDLRFDPEGVRCRIEVPLREAAEAA